MEKNISADSGILNMAFWFNDGDDYSELVEDLTEARKINSEKINRYL